MIDLNEPAIVIVGSGAGGGTLAHELTTRGFPVVLLEAGPRIEPRDFHQDDLAAYRQLTWQDPRVATGSWAGTGAPPAAPAWIVKAVGGSTLHWGGLSFRPQAHEFKARSTYGEIEDSSLADWPLDLEALTPYYVKAEAKLGVTGTPGHPVQRSTNHYKVLWNGARRIGYTNISNARLAINSVAFDERPACLELGFCLQGCMVSAKWSTLVSDIPKAEATGLLDLRIGAMAIQVEHDAAGLINGVVYIGSDRVRKRQRARLVCIAGNSIETARLLLLSRSNAFPNGLANNSGQVGRHYQRHIGALTYAVMPQPVHMQRGTASSGVIYDEARHDASRGFAGGYLMQSTGLSPVSLAMLLEPAGWGREFSSFIESYDHIAGMLMVGEEMPRADNRITLSDTVRDANGLPVAQIHVDEHPQSDVMRAHFRTQSAALYRSLGATDIRHGVTAVATHNLGTCRMSLRHEDGVVNSFGQAHEVTNLFISDGSQFTSSTAENPTLTIVALAIRQAEHLATRLAARDL